MRRPRTSPEEQYRLVMDCRQSGLSDTRWCEENDIQPSTFYNWVTRLRKKGCEIPPPTSKEDFLRKCIIARTFSWLVKFEIISLQNSVKQSEKFSTQLFRLFKEADYEFPNKFYCKTMPYPVLGDAD